MIFQLEFGTVPTVWYFVFFILFQLGVVVYDIAYPEDRDATNVTITVDRNPSPPVFNPQQYSRTINESYPIGLSLVQLIASDPDNVSDIF